MGRLRKLAAWLQERFALVFLVCAALAVTSLLDKLQVARDISTSLIEMAQKASLFDQVISTLVMGCSIAIEWWRSATSPFFEWLSDLVRIELNQPLRDLMSCVFFVMGRTVNATLATYRRTFPHWGRDAHIERLYSKDLQRM